MNTEATTPESLGETQLEGGSASADSHLESDEQRREKARLAKERLEKITADAAVARADPAWTARRDLQMASSPRRIATEQSGILGRLMRSQ